MNPNENPEALHEKAKSLGTTQVAKTEFVNPGTSATPLADMSSKPNPEVSVEATAKLRSGLIK